MGRMDRGNPACGRLRQTTQPNTSTAPLSLSPAAIMVEKKGEAAEKEETTLGPQAKEGELVFGVCHIYASFNVRLGVYLPTQTDQHRTPSST